MDRQRWNCNNCTGAPAEEHTLFRAVRCFKVENLGNRLFAVTPETSINPLAQLETANCLGSIRISPCFPWPRCHGLSRTVKTFYQVTNRFQIPVTRSGI